MHVCMKIRYVAYMYVHMYVYKCTKDRQVHSFNVYSNAVPVFCCMQHSINVDSGIIIHNVLSAYSEHCAVCLYLRMYICLITDILWINKRSAAAVQPTIKTRLIFLLFSHTCICRYVCVCLYTKASEPTQGCAAAVAVQFTQRNERMHTYINTYIHALYEYLGRYLWRLCDKTIFLLLFVLFLCPAHTYVYCRSVCTLVIFGIIFCPLQLSVTLHIDLLRQLSKYALYEALPTSTSTSPITQQCKV